MGIVPAPEAEKAVRDRLGRFRTLLDGSGHVEFPARGAVGPSSAMVCDLTFQRHKSVSAQARDFALWLEEARVVAAALARH
jgi:hypothetical protein